MKKKILSLILALTLVLPLCPAFELPLLSMPASAATSGYYTYTVSDGKATITDVKTSISGEITIPSTLGGYPVTSIGVYAFSGCSSLTSISISGSVTSIGDRAFYYCDSLTSITVAEGNSVYHSSGNCLIETSSKTLVLGCKNSVIPTDGSVTSIGEYAFCGCSSLTSIAIPDSVTSIGESAFSVCSSLTFITVAEGNPVYHSSGNCLIETSSKTLVLGCKNSVIPTDGFVTSIGDDAFSNCSSLTSITIPDSVTSIGSDAFRGCSSLTSIVIPDSVTSIGNWAFFECSSLTSITIPDSVTAIGDYAFWCCKSLTSITIPDSVTSIGNWAFRDCESLTHVWYEGSKADRAKISIEGYNEDLTSATWHYDSCIKNPDTNKVHVFDNACDTACNVCGQTRTPPHDYTIQDKNTTYHWIKCSLCGRMNESTRAPHVYDDACDADCNVCGQTRTPSDHVYDGVCDTDCNVCGQTRTPPHDYTVQDMDETNHWLKCALCGRVDESTRSSHAYDNACDDSCNGCDFKRIPPHAYDSASDYECNLCLIRRPAAPKSESVVGTTVTLKTVEGCEYSTDGFTWQASPVFEDLDPVTTYTFYQRYAETVVYYASAASLGTKVTTKKATPSAPAAPTAVEITKTSVTLVKEDGMQYSLDGKTWKTSSVFTGLRRGGVYTFYVRYGETSTHYASPASEALEVQTLKDPQLAPKAPTLVKVTGTSVTLFAAEGIEYSKDGETWQSEATFRGLTPDTEYTFYQRQAEKDEYYASPASEALVVKTPNVRVGDVDGNGTVDLDDAIYFLFHVNFPEFYPINQNGNFDGKGEVDLDDAIYFLFHVNFPEFYPLP